MTTLTPCCHTTGLPHATNTTRTLSRHRPDPLHAERGFSRSGANVITRNTCGDMGWANAYGAVAVRACLQRRSCRRLLPGMDETLEVQTIFQRIEIHDSQQICRDGACQRAACADQASCCPHSCRLKQEQKHPGIPPLTNHRQFRVNMLSQWRSRRFLPPCQDVPAQFPELFVGIPVMIVRPMYHIHRSAFSLSMRRNSSHKASIQEFVSFRCQQID